MESELYCMECRSSVKPKLIYGNSIYPMHPKLWGLPFWQCLTCGNYVGCHHKTDTPTKPLGVIPSAPMRKARKEIHALMDPLWKAGKVQRSDLYTHLGTVLGRPYHTADLMTLEEARMVWRELKLIADGKKKLVGEVVDETSSDLYGDR